MSEPFVADVNREALRHAIKMWAVCYDYRSNDIARQFEYTPDMSTLIPYDDFLEDLDHALGGRPYGFDLGSIVEGNHDMLEQLSSFANQKCDELTSLYESYIRRLNDKFEMQINPNKIPKHN